MCTTILVHEMVVFCGVDGGSKQEHRAKFAILCGVFVCLQLLCAAKRLLSALDTYILLRNNLESIATIALFSSLLCVCCCKRVWDSHMYFM
jgi:hypothetical protein